LKKKIKYAKNVLKY